MLIFIGADHRGFNLKEKIKKELTDSGYEVIDSGNDRHEEGDDYVDFALKVAKEVSLEPTSRRGVLVCGSGVGVDIVANKVRGVRSALCFSPEQAMASREHDDANVLSLPSDFLDEDTANRIVFSWLQAKFDGKEDHQRRLDKLSRIERD